MKNLCVNLVYLQRWILGSRLRSVLQIRIYFKSSFGTTLLSKKNNHHEGHISRVCQISNLLVSALDFVLSSEF